MQSMDGAHLYRLLDVLARGVCERYEMAKSTSGARFFVLYSDFFAQFAEDPGVIASNCFPRGSRRCSMGLDKLGRAASNWR